MPKTRAHFFFAAWLFLGPLLASAAMPTKSDVDRVVDKHFNLVDKEVTAAQKSKILNYVSGYPSANSSCPGYEMKQGLSHVETLNKAGAFFQAGFEAVFKGNIKAAEWCFLKALKLNTECPVVLSNAAFTLNYFGHFADSLILLNYAISRDALFASAWVNIAYASGQTKNYAAAKKALQIAIGLNPEIEDYKKALSAIYSVSGERKKVDAAKLDAALQALNKDKESSAEGAKPGKGASAKQPRDQAGDSLETLVSKMGSSYSSDMAVLGQFIPILSKAGAEYLRESDWHGQKAKESSGTSKNVHLVGEQADKLLSTLFTGYISEITGSWQQAEDVVSTAYHKDTKPRPADYNPAKGLAPEFKLPPISVGFDGLSFKFNPGQEEIEMEIGEGVIFGFSSNPKGWGVKIGLGVQAHGAVIGGEAAYFIKYDSVQGWMTEGKVAGECAGVRWEMPVHEQNFSFEPVIKSGKEFLGISEPAGKKK